MNGGMFVRVCVLIIMVLGLTGCEGERKLTEFQTQYLDCFDTITSVTVCTGSQKEFDELDTELHEELLRYHKLFDIYNSYDGINNLKTINDNAGIKPVKVDREIIRMLEYAVEQYDMTGGRVNVAMGSVLSIWHDYRTAGLKKPELAQIPELELLQKAERYTEIEQMIIDRETSTVYLPDSSMKLDAGAIAKGYAVGKACEFLKEKGVTAAVVSAGGNVETIGVRTDGKRWRIAIQNPDINSESPYLYVANLQDMALVTSGIYQRFYEVEGKKYHHIINPDTLMPWEEYASVTILCKESKAADALSTAVFNMTLEEGQALIESLENTEALWVMLDGTEEFSSGMKSYLEN